MRFVDLFAGIGGFSLGLERAGMECAGQVEMDGFCKGVLERHWPHVKRMGDIHEVRGDEFGAVELVCGGFPCQPFSVAGKRRGKKDDRYLWPEMLRVIELYRPDWVLGENVAGIVSMALDKVLSDLEGAGYSCRAFIVPACAVDAPHRRDRVWIVAHSEHNGRSGTEKSTGLGTRSGPSSGEKGTEQSSGPGGMSGRLQIVANRDGSGFGKQRRTESIQKEYGAVECFGENVADTEGKRCRETGGRFIRSEKWASGNSEIISDTEGLRRRQGNQDSGKCNEGTGKKEEWAGLADGSGWLPEPDVGRVAARLSTTLDETIKDYGYENEHDTQAFTKIDTVRGEVLREMWFENKVKQTSLQTTRECSENILYEMSCIRAYERWKLGQRIENNTELRNMWEKICSKVQSPTQNLLSTMLERIREKECNEKVESSRVDRLRALGNAVVPQVVEVFGRAILETERFMHGLEK